MKTIKCAKCKCKVFRYLKIGKGRVLHCWKSRIFKDYSIRGGNEVKCQCGNLISIDEGKWTKIMKQHSFIYLEIERRVDIPMKLISARLYSDKRQNLLGSYCTNWLNVQFLHDTAQEILLVS